MRPKKAWTGSLRRMRRASNSNASIHKYKVDKVLAVTLEILSCSDVAVLRHALLEPSHLFEHRVQHPPHVHRLLPEIEAFSGITFQVKHHGELHVRDGLTDAVGLAENDFEVPPLHRHQPAVKAEIEDRLSSGGVPLAQQIVRGIDPIKRTVGGNALRFPNQSSERRQPVYGGEQFLALPSGRDMPRPAHHGRDAVTAFVR